MSATPPDPGTTSRTRVRRLPERAVHEREALHGILDAGLVGHLAVVDDDGQPFVVPVGYARDGDRVLVHGSTGSRLMRSLAAGAPTCFTVTLLDGLVLARSAFESSMNYRSVMVLGRAETLEGEDKQRALEVLSEHLIPGRWAQIRHPSGKELAATLVLALPLDECSVKVRSGPPQDLPEDVDLPVWGGVVPVANAFGDPVPDERAAGSPVPAYLSSWGGTSR